MKVRKTKFDDYESVVKFPVLSNYFVHVVFTDHIGRSRKGRYGSEGAAEGAAALSSQAVNGHGHLFFKISNTPGIIAHEAWHAVYRMFEWAGAELDNEMVAYHLSFLVDRIASFKSRIEFWEAHSGEGESKGVQSPVVSQEQTPATCVETAKSSNQQTAGVDALRA